ncbi:putative PIN domain protein [Candidatus Termititenax aidoneus]|uniref:PIN domain protein n=1 Tax=Termititenax aidoneus TaxID=2218524 RepID=A0A388TAY1_TERA1|nr:putative PIN domain protein [Candidatus Termititenax aidoneus]
MLKKVFVDSDIVLDLLCGREPFYEPAASLFDLGETGKIKLYTSALVFANVFFILRKVLGNEQAKTLLRKLELLLAVLAVDKKTVSLALNSHFQDFEDALQYFTARENSLPVLVTRNSKDYQVKDIIVQTAAEYLSGSVFV